MKDYTELENYLKSINNASFDYLQYHRSNLPSSFYPKESCLEILDSLCKTLKSHKITNVDEFDSVQISTSNGRSFDMPSKFFDVQGNELKDFLIEDFYSCMKSKFMDLSEDSMLLSQLGLESNVDTIFE